MRIEPTELSGNFPKQLLPFYQKGKKWRASCVNWGAERNVLQSPPIRKNVQHKQINYDLLNGKLHMEDLQLVLNPNQMDHAFVPANIQHFPIMNTKLQVLQGEESKRVFDYSVVVTNPNSLSQIEENKKEEALQRLQKLIADNSLSEDEYLKKVQDLQYYLTYQWKDLKEVRANAILSHYSKEYNFPNIFNQGFRDAMAIGEEIYQCAIIQGEPTLRKLNPRQVRVYQSGFSNRIEDADMIVIEDYWSPGKIIDTYHDVLTKKDIEYIENIHMNVSAEYTALAGKYNDGPSFTPGATILRQDDEGEISFQQAPSITPSDLFSNPETLSDLLPYDFNGNVRVCQVFWKSRRLIKKVKSYDPMTGEETWNLFPEDYICNPDMGEEEFQYWINEAWQGTKIGDKIFVNMGPCPIQYNRLNNPSKCHFGIIGSIYNLNDDKPFSLVDIMKPYNYFYDVCYDRLNKLIERNYGKIIRLDLAKIPEGWKMEEWMSILKTAGIAVEDSFKEGNKGVATGKLAGAMNNASSGVVDAELGQSIQSQIALLNYIKEEMSESVGISKQREGQISNRETVGGVERATLQSSHITEWLFITHDDTKKRVLECFLETAKIAFKGRNKKFPYILSDSSQVIMDIDGDEFSESDYGILVDNSNGIQELKNNLPTLIQAGLQNQAISFSTAMKIWNSTSMAEKQRMIENDERQIKEAQAQAQQQQAQLEQQKLQAEQQDRQAKMEQEDLLNQRDNETKILIANIQANSKQEALNSSASNLDSRDKLNEQIREFNEKLAFDRDKLNREESIKKAQLAKKNK